LQDYSYLGVVLSTVAAASGVETNDLVAKNVRTRSERSRDLHSPGEAVLCMPVSKCRLQSRTRNHELMMLSEAQVPGGLASLMRPLSAILKKLKDAAEVDALWLLTLAR
jgi:hypothetical protein